MHSIHSLILFGDRPKAKNALAGNAHPLAVRKPVGCMLQLKAYTSLPEQRAEMSIFPLFLASSFRFGGII
jgi:hypothetical protein